jgi:ketosteroid isomerase-like protein
MTMANAVTQKRAGHFCPVKRSYSWLRDKATKLGLFTPLSAQIAGGVLAVTVLGGLVELNAAASSSLNDLIKRTERQAQLFVAGDMQEWIKLIRLSDDFTLMQPFGGPTSHGFDQSPQRLAQLAAYFRNGTATLDLHKTYVTRDMIVLVFVEQQTGEVGDTPNQEWSLRVTQVYRRARGEWELVHRHADPLVKKRDLNATAAIARGE